MGGYWMLNRFFLFCTYICFLIPGFAFSNSQPVALSNIAQKNTAQYNLDYDFRQGVQGQGQISFSQNITKLEFELASTLKIVFEDQKQITKIDEDSYLVQFQKPTSVVTFQVQGSLKALDGSVAENTPAFSKQSLDPHVYSLSPEDRWYPVLESSLITFNLKIHHSFKTLITNGGSSKNESKMPFPQQGIFLVFSPYELLQDAVDPRIQYLVSPSHQNLISRWSASLNAAMGKFTSQFGPYPYENFVLIENTQPTGFGMPGFTLIGSTVLELPFLTESSIPHELLHNWWGNGVFVQTKYGNWSEAMTTFFSDHFYQEKVGKGLSYRRQALKNYLIARGASQDFPFASFRERFDSITQAVGYSKGLLMIQMLKGLVGPTKFAECTQNFYRKNLFKQVDFESLLNTCLDSSSSLEREMFLDSWVKRDGFPDLKIELEDVEKTSTSFQVSVRVRQSGGYIFPLRLRLQYADGTFKDFMQKILKNETVVVMDSKQEPVSIVIDPEYEIVRSLGSLETAASAQEVFARKKLFVPVELRQRSDFLERRPTLERLGFELLEKDDKVSPVLYLNQDGFQSRIFTQSFQLDGWSLKGTTLRPIPAEGDVQFDTNGNAWFAVQTDHLGRLHFWLQLKDSFAAVVMLQKLNYYGSSSWVIFDHQRKVYQSEWDKTILPWTIRLPKP